MVYRVFVEKRAGLDNEAKGLLSEVNNLLGITKLKLLNMMPAVFLPILLCQFM